VARGASWGLGACGAWQRSHSIEKDKPTQARFEFFNVFYFPKQLSAKEHQRTPTYWMLEKSESRKTKIISYRKLSIVSSCFRWYVSARLTPFLAALSGFLCAAF
jgi:hypothetical protein